MSQNSVNAIDYFYGPFDFLSNFYLKDIVVDGLVYPSVEHAFQAAKTSEPDLKEEIRTAVSPKEAKRLGRRVPLIADWDTKRFEVMESLVRSKFVNNLDLKLNLLLTGSKELIEGNTWGDRVWGVTRDGIGENHLGKILMKVRAEIRAEEGGAINVLIKYLRLNGLGAANDKLLTVVQLLQETVDTVTNQVAAPGDAFFDAFFDDVKDVLDSLQ